MSDNNSLFAEDELQEDWKKEWQDMPEFVQDKLEPYCAMIVRFRSEEDLQEFAKLIEQNLNNKTKSIWYPKLDVQKLVNTRYVIPKKNDK
jgi:hypothetical protein